MTSIHNRTLRPIIAARTPVAVLAFLVPSVQCTRNAPIARFSTSPIRCKKDNNSNRGLSSIRNTGLRRRQTLSVIQKDFKQQALPKPVPIEEEVNGTPDHGLWDFFKDNKLLQKPVDEHAHGREWTMGELRNRDFDVLHRLWWVCAKERNRLATARIELKRITAGTGEAEIKARDKTVQKTMKAILDTLAERHTAYSEAYELAKNDPTIDLLRTDGPQLDQAPAYDSFEPEVEEPQIEEPKVQEMNVEQSVIESPPRLSTKATL